MTVAQLISLLQQCDQTASVDWNYDALLSLPQEMLETLVEIGRDVVWLEE